MPQSHKMSEELNGFLTVADISGYTAYLNASELDHARGTLTELLGVLIDGAGPPLTISKLEGDAVFSYGFEDGFLEGQTLVEIIEGTYVAFRRAVDLMVLNNTCRCNACANVSSLDLKFFVHFGSFAVQHLAGRDELLGPDVNLVHRLMKNTVARDLGIGAYCLYTEAARVRLGLGEEPWLRPHEEQVADFGSVTGWVQDMAPVYERATSAAGIELDDDDILFEVEADIPVDPPVLWDYLSVPEFRNLLVGSDRQEITDRRDGRIAPGTTFQCYHGDHVVPQLVLEWEPFSKMVTRDGMMAPAKGTVVGSLRARSREDDEALPALLDGSLRRGGDPGLGIPIGLGGARGRNRSRNRRGSCGRQPRRQSVRLTSTDQPSGYQGGLWPST
jgi:hypothetical protein